MMDPDSFFGNASVVLIILIFLNFMLGLQLPCMSELNTSMQELNTSMQERNRSMQELNRSMQELN